MSNFGDLYITVFADASFCHQTGATGYAVWIKYGLNQTATFSNFSSMPKNSTEAELLGLTKAMAFVQDNIPYQGKRLVIQCDNVNALENVDVPFAGFLLSIRRKHVKAHQNGINKRSWVNEWCDRNAKFKMREMRRQLCGKSRK